MAGRSKTPEEIKKGMKQDCGECDEENFCPYIGIAGCIGILHKDALAYIRRLERDKAWASENYDLIREENKRIEAQNAELLEKVKQLERERDAAIHDLKKARECRSCKHIDALPSEQPCKSCGIHGRNYEWRGPCEENGGSDA